MSFRLAQEHLELLLFQERLECVASAVSSTLHSACTASSRGMKRLDDSICDVIHTARVESLCTAKQLPEPVDPRRLTAEFAEDIAEEKMSQAGSRSEHSHRS